MTKYNITELDVFYISYDEPKKEEFWADLLYKCPWAKRVDGVKGFDSAHKACAEQSETELLITIDGDNKVDPKLFDEQLVFDSEESNTVYSFSGKNMINGLIYGNGGIKVWPRELVKNMRTHENAETERAAIEFCWEIYYQQMNNCYCEVWPNGSPLQAFRSGFREGVKMSLAEGKTVAPDDFKTKIFHKNLQRLLIWSTIGRDVPNGDWAIYGARLGCVKTALEQDASTVVRDYDWFDHYWETELVKDFTIEDGEYDEGRLQRKTKDLGVRMEKELGVTVADMDAHQSKFFKKVFVNPLRVSPKITEKQMTAALPKEFQ